MNAAATSRLLRADLASPGLSQLLICIVAAGGIEPPLISHTYMPVAPFLRVFRSLEAPGGLEPPLSVDSQVSPLWAGLCSCWLRHLPAFDALM